MDRWVGSDRRKYPRIPVEDLVSFAPLDEKDRVAVGRDLSEGGIRFEVVGCEIELGEVIRLTFNVAEQTLVAVGRVVWATELDALTMDIGLEFLEIDRAARVLIESALTAGSGSQPTVV